MSRQYKKPDPNCVCCRGEEGICSMCGAFDTNELKLTRENAALLAERDALAADVNKARDERDNANISRDAAMDEQARHWADMDRKYREMATANAALRAENERMRVLIERAQPWVEHGLPPDRGHSCGPESACDGECVDLARGCALLLDIRAALNP